MKKLLFIIFVAMLAACGQQGASSGTNGGTVNSDVGAYNVKLNIADPVLRSADATTAVTVSAIKKADNQEISSEAIKTLGVKFMVGTGLTYSSDAKDPTKFTVKRNVGSDPTGDVSVMASLGDGSKAVGTITISNGALKFDAATKAITEANSAQTISVSVQFSGVDDAKGRTLNAYVDNQLNGTPQITDEQGKATFIVKLPNGQDKPVTIKVEDAVSKTAAEHQIKVKAAPKDGMTLSLVKGEEVVNYFNANNTEHRIKVQGTGTTLKPNDPVTFSATQAGVAVGACTLDANLQCLATVQSANVGVVVVTGSSKGLTASVSFSVAPEKATKAKVDYSKNISAKLVGSAASSSSQSRILIQATDANGIGVPGVKIQAQKAVGNPGQFSNPSNGILVTDNQGFASVTYEAPEVAGTYRINFTAVPAVTGLDPIDIVVYERALKVVAVSDNVLQLDADGSGTSGENAKFLRNNLTFLVTDNNGNAIDGATIELKATLEKFYFGCYAKKGEAWIQGARVAKQQGVDSANIDVGGANFSPIKPPVVATTTAVFMQPKSANPMSTLTTAGGGIATIDLRYSRAESTWTQINLSVTAKQGEVLQDSIEFKYELAGITDDSKVDKDGVATPIRFSPHNGKYSPQLDATNSECADKASGGGS